MILLDKPFFIMLVGVSGSGKSYVSNKILKKYSEEKPMVILSSDELRAELLNDVNVQSNNTLIFNTMHERTVSNLKNGISVIYDATNLTIKDRRQILDKIQNINCCKIAYVMSTHMVLCRIRNARRDRVVPEEVLEKQRTKFQFPLYNEGFDIIDLDNYNSFLFDYEYLHPNSLSNGFQTVSIKPLLQLMRGVEQDTHYHDFTLLEHQERTYNFVKERLKEAEVDLDSKRYLLQACLIHDFGKLFTRTTNKIGESSYYGHANVGTYNLLSRVDELELYDFKEILKCISLINYHMDMFNLYNAKPSTIKKKRQVFGDLYEDLVLLHEADMKSSKKEVK